MCIRDRSQAVRPMNTARIGGAAASGRLDCAARLPTTELSARRRLLRRQAQRQRRRPARLQRRRRVRRAARQAARPPVRPRPRRP
eukprot:7964932-Pyramimonas_sp.AAC.1